MVAGPYITRPTAVENFEELTEMDGRQSWYPDEPIGRVTDDRGPILDEARNAKWEELVTRFAQLLQLFEGGLLVSKDQFVSQVKT